MPMTWIFIAWPLTGITWLLFGFERLRADLRIVIDGPAPEAASIRTAISAPGASYERRGAVAVSRQRGDLQ
jgi:hypothetical protein